MLKVDLHSHTNYFIPKKDSRLSPKQLIDFVASRNYDVLAITEHASLRHIGGIEYFDNPVRTYFDFKEYAKKKGILLIPGVETFVEGKEVLLINFRGKDTRNLKTFADIERLKAENVLVIAPHPFYKKPSCLGNKLIGHIDVFDAIEHCHFYSSFINPNKKAIDLAKKYSKPLVASSDAHSFNQIDINFSWVDAEKNIDSILDAIRKNKIKMDTRPLPFFRFMSIATWATLAIFKKRIM